MPLIILFIMFLIEALLKPRIQWTDNDKVLLAYGRKIRKFILL